MDNKEHPIYTVLQDKIEFVNNELLTKGMNDTEYKSLLLWKDLLEYVNVVLNSKRFPNIPKSFLNDLQNSLASLSRPVVHNYPGYSMHYNNVLTQTKRIPVVEYRGDVKQSFANMVNQFEKRTAKTISDFKESQKDIISTWNAEKNIWEKELSELKNTSSSIVNELKTLKQEIVNQKVKNENLISELRDKFVEFGNEEKRDIDILKEEFSTKLEQFDSEYKNKAQEILSHLHKRKDEIEKLWGIIGKASVSGQAQSYATKACRLAHFMMVLALLIMGYACYNIYAITTSIVTNSATIQPGVLIFRLLAAAILFAPAFYCMNVAKRQRDREFQLRDFEVKTAALEPFMERMKLGEGSKEAKDKTKIELTRTFFDKEFAKENKQHKDILLSEDMLEGLLKIGSIFRYQNSERK